MSTLLPEIKEHICSVFSDFYSFMPGARGERALQFMQIIFRPGDVGADTYYALVVRVSTHTYTLLIHATFPKANVSSIRSFLAG